MPPRRAHSTLLGWAIVLCSLASGGYAMLIGTRSMVAAPCTTPANCVATTSFERPAATSQPSAAKAADEALAAATAAFHASIAELRRLVADFRTPVADSLVDQQAGSMGVVEETRFLADQALLLEMNSNRAEDLKSIARVMAPAQEAEFERLEHAEIIAANQDYMEIEEVLCSAVDDRCIAISVPIEWPNKCSTAEEMRAAFDRLTAQVSGVDPNAIPQRYVAEEQQLEGLLHVLNRDFAKLVRFFGMRFGHEAIKPTEQIEAVQMTQLNLQGFTLELTAMDLADDRMPRTRSHISVLFEHACQSIEEVEDMMITMFTKESEQA